MTRRDNAHVDYGYDNIGQLVSATGYEPDGTTLRANEDMAYTYDAAGNLRTRNNHTLAQTFSTDGANQLTSVARNNDLLTVAGSLNTNATSLTVNGAGATLYGDLTFAVTSGVNINDGLNVLTNVLNGTLTNTTSKTLPVTVNLAYDANGNLTSDGLHGYEYDCANELTRVTATNDWKVEYAYDGLGRRRIRTEYKWDTGTSGWLKADETRYVYDGLNALQERNLLNTPKVSYTRGLDLSGTMQGAGGIGGLLARTDSTGSAFYHTDGNGNVTMLIDAAGSQKAKYLYDPYGNTLGMWGPLAEANKYRHSSMEHDALADMDLFTYRVYFPNLHRWGQRDPIGERGGINLYGYVGNNPVNRIDALGLWTFEAYGGAILGFYFSFGKNSGHYSFSLGLGLGGGSSVSFDPKNKPLEDKPGTKGGGVMGKLDASYGPVGAGVGGNFGGKCYSNGKQKENANAEVCGSFAILSGNAGVGAETNPHDNGTDSEWEKSVEKPDWQLNIPTDGNVWNGNWMPKERIGFGGFAGNYYEYQF